MLFYVSPLISEYFWPASTLLHGHIALAIPSPLETDPHQFMFSRRSFFGHAQIESLSGWVITCSGCARLLFVFFDMVFVMGEMHKDNGNERDRHQGVNARFQGARLLMNSIAKCHQVTS